MYAAAEDIEAGTRKPKFQTEPTLPIYLKVLHFTCQKGFVPPFIPCLHPVFKPSK